MFTFAATTGAPVGCVAVNPEGTICPTIKFFPAGTANE